jgi:NAD(P)-dependent dehydrogenase (short-subunit alcohol dehydrogenase family)
VKLSSSISAVVTGGASGLGAATARMLASHGVKVALFDLNTDLGEPLAEQIGGIFCNVNVTSSPEVDAAFAKGARRSGRSASLSTAQALAAR